MYINRYVSQFLTRMNITFTRSFSIDIIITCVLT